MPRIKHSKDVSDNQVKTEPDKKLDSTGSRLTRKRKRNSAPREGESLYIDAPTPDTIKENVQAISPAQLKKAKKSSKRKIKKEPKVETEPISEITNISDAAGDASLSRNMKAVGKLGPVKRSEAIIGAHVSIQGGLEKAFDNALEIGARSFACFLRSQRKWESKPLTEETVVRFKKAMKESGIDPDNIIPHGIYLLNCGSPNVETLAKSRKVLTEELQCCDRLGLTRYNFHPGSTCGLIDRTESINRIAVSINQAHAASKGVVVLLENMSKQGNTIGGDFSELAAIIALVTDKSRVGVCLDTCHAYAAGWDLSKEAGLSALITEIEGTVGLARVLAVHLNDSKGALGSHLDRHEDLGRGRIGWEGLMRLVTHPGLRGRPVVLETPGWTDYQGQIEQVYRKIPV